MVLSNRRLLRMNAGIGLLDFSRSSKQWRKILRCLIQIELKKCINGMTKKVLLKRKSKKLLSQFLFGKNIFICLIFFSFSFSGKRENEHFESNTVLKIFYLYKNFTSYLFTFTKLFFHFL